MIPTFSLLALFMSQYLLLNQTFSWESLGAVVHGHWVILPNSRAKFSWCATRRIGCLLGATSAALWHVRVEAAWVRKSRTRLCVSWKSFCIPNQFHVGCIMLPDVAHNQWFRTNGIWTPMRP